jgi:hypothetical protein
MRFNAYNHPLGPRLDDINQDRVPASVLYVGSVTNGMAHLAALEKIFIIDPASPLATDGCRLVYASGSLLCLDGPAPVGAILPSGRRFDLDLPFRFPFTEALRETSRPGSVQ